MLYIQTMLILNIGQNPKKSKQNSGLIHLTDRVPYGFDGLIQVGRRGLREKGNIMIPDMDDKQTAAYLRKWVKGTVGCHGPFAWPTDGCGYDQHIKFANHRNKNWTEDKAKQISFEQFILDYAESLEAQK